MFKYLALRLRMYKTLDKINTILSSTSFITGDDLAPFLEDLPTLHALSSAGCINVDYFDDEITAVSAGKNGYLYILGRSELWFNRIVSFIAGFLSAVAAGYIIKLL